MSNEHTAESDAPATDVAWAHVLDDAGSADLYETEAEARAACDQSGGGVDRIETTTVVPFRVTSPAVDQPTAATEGDRP